MQGNFSSPFLLFRFFQGILGASVAAPGYGLGILLPRKSLDLYFVRYHEGGIESQAKMADNGIAVLLVLFEEILCTGEGNLVDILLDLLAGHPDPCIGNGQGLFLFIQVNPYGQVTQLSFVFANRSKGFKLLSSIHRVGDKFP